jgi:hypothetical protein
VKLETIDISTVGSWSQLRKNVGDLLQLDADNLGQLKTAVSILAPLVGSIVGVSAGK